MLYSTKLLLTTAIVLTTLTACDKQAPAKADTKTATSTTTTTVTTTSTPAVTVSPATPVSAPTSIPATSVQNNSSSSIAPTAPTGNSIVTQPVTAGTPEATVKNAVDTLMNGTPKQAAIYYQVDMPNFDKVLAEQQPMVKQQLKHLELEPTIYNEDKTKAFIVGKMTTTASPTPQTMKYKLVKIKNEWKLVP